MCTPALPMAGREHNFQQPCSLPLWAPTLHCAPPPSSCIRKGLTLPLPQRWEFQYAILSWGGGEVYRGAMPPDNAVAYWSRGAFCLQRGERFAAHANVPLLVVALTKPITLFITDTHITYLTATLLIWRLSFSRRLISCMCSPLLKNII